MVFTRSVCIIGAGPSGLAAAKAFLQHGSYVVTVYEVADRVGGMWRARSGDYGDKCSPEMRINLSRFTVGFSDLSWSSVDLSDPVTGAASPSAPPMFPKAWQVGRYLEKYTEKFGLESNIFFNRKVVNADILEDMKTWQVSTYDLRTDESETKTFDYLVIASGFFNQRGRSFAPSAGGNTSNIQHSSAFRDLLSLTEKSGKIAVIGGGISGSEAAAQAAFQISSAKNSPGKSKPAYAESRIYHIINRPFYSLPRYLPQNPLQESSQDTNLAPTFLPLDLVLYNLSRRGEGEISASITTVPPEKAQKGHEFMRSVIGGDQQEYGSPALVYAADQTQYPAYCGISDTYLEFVRSGLIVPVQGWVESIEQKDDGDTLDIALEHKGPWSREAGTKSQLSDVTGIIEAMGYKVDLDYLHDTPKGFLYPDSSCPRIPFLLTRGSMLSDNPTLGFVGFYEGPYWGVMEVQARYIANSWFESTPDPMNFPRVGLNQLDTTERMRHQLRSEGSLQVPQFWMADYVGIIEEIAREAGVTRKDSAFGGQNGPVFPSRYQGSGTDNEADVVVQEVANTLKASNEDAKFVAAAVFRAMQGVWSLHRKIASHNTNPGGVLTGTAQFHPRAPTDPAYAAEYLYIEKGVFSMDNGLSFHATRRYVYRYNETTDKITAWFVDEDGESTGVFFNMWEFYPPADERHGWMAKGHHWCDPDTYKSGCEFKFRGASLQSFGITYEVAGPKKDYNHESSYERPKNQESSTSLL
ncbi:uncharacterized protein M421DRAFT_281828 [Didymella exigua CBS 183.55]|uniref:Uncharacterized protein n=1 Tax=Didymella exigua CBS 183.55 TaxID=1150837 RepID=A0A6A5R871_9PLEO|nr:uncharacterized protein M421DRAFT_281828 [Didymella exigua CBS 183.55]KAF1924401.1 hypothetical protein M421DRAFT_281828 [Didymella exigua CBS 183.55]